MADKKKLSVKDNAIARALTLFMAEEQKDYENMSELNEKYSTGYFTFKGFMIGITLAHEHPEALQGIFNDLAEFDPLGAEKAHAEVRDSADIIVEGMEALQRIMKREGLDTNEPRPRGTGLDGLFRGSGFDDRTH